MNNFLYLHNKYLRYLLLLSLITFVILFMASAAHGAWYPDSNWQYRKKITIQSSRVSGGPHSNFPVLIKLAADSDLAAHAQDDHDDILFTSDDEVTKIAHEIEKFDGGTGELVTWVKIGSVSSSGNTDIYMYYGNGTATNQENASQVWSNGYRGVWHLHDTSGDTQDSTSYNTDGVLSGTVTRGATGEIDNAFNFSTNGEVDWGDPGDGHLDFGTGEMTLSLWVNMDNHRGVWEQIILKGKSSWQPGYQIEVNASANNFYFTINDGSYSEWGVSSNISFSLDTWYYVVGVVDRSNNLLRAYRNGVQVDTSGISGVGSINVADELTIGRNTWGWPDARIEEVRLANTARSADWIKTEYNNQVWPNTAVTPSPLPNPNPGGGFIEVYSEESGGGGGNQAPTVDAGSNQTITLPDSASLYDASASDSDGPSGLTYTWTKESGPGSVTFTPGDDELNPTASFSVAGAYVLKLSVYDGETWGEDTVTITVYAVGGGPLVADYSCNMKITIDSGQVAGDLSNFPVLINVTDESLKTSGCGFMTDPAGDDLIFTNSAKTIQLDHEIEKYDGSVGQLVAWVEVPFLSGSADTDIYMYYGNSNVTTPQESPTGVWDEGGANDYVGVWHLQDQTDIEDSTAYSNDGTPSNVDDDAGVIEGGQDFDGNDYITIGQPANGSLDFDHTTDFCISAWFKTDDISSTNGYDTLVGQRRQTSIALGLDDNGDKIYFRMDDSSYHRSDNAVTFGQWYHVALCYDYVSGTTGNSYMYVNGASQSTNGLNTYNDMNLDSWYIGYEGRWGDEYFDGDIDEVRISRTVRSAQWFATSYNNQNDPLSFYSTEVQCPQPVPENFACSLDITVHYTQVSGSSTLADFPVLISLTDDALKTTANCGYVTNSSGYDIMFTDFNDNQLDHEIEKYDGSTGELVAWVKKTISPTADDPQNIIRLYYGNSDVCGSLEKPTAVWDADYKGVWHLDEEQAGTGNSGLYKDSTSNDNDGDDDVSATGQEGQISGGQQFDGTDDYVDSGNKSNLDVDYLTIEFWLKVNSWVNNGGILAKGTDSSRQYWIWTYGGAVSFEIDEGTYRNNAWNPPAGQWENLVLNYDGSNVRTYRNGDQEINTYLQTTGTIDATTEPLLLGDLPSYNHADVNLDEVRISASARSADWIKTSYNNQSDPVSFYTITNHTCAVSEPNPAEFRCWRPITIDEQYVVGSDPLENFPLLIKINSDPLLEVSNPPTDCGKVENPDGYDIIFTDEYGTELLDHEVEVYNSGTGKLVAWVRIPWLSATSDTVIRMYYGNANIQCPTENPAGVWSYEGSPYEAVYHLQYDVNDATSNGRHGYNNSSDDDDGVIERSRDFTPVEDFDAGTWAVSGQGLTLQAWVDFDDFDQDDPRVIDKASGTGTDYHVFMLGLGDTGDGIEHHPRFRVKTNYDDATAGSTTTLLASGYQINTDWHLLAGTYDGNYMRLLVDGQQVASAAKTGDLGVNNWKITVGNQPDYSNSTRYSMDGELDELRVLSTARSADWLRTEWYNQNGSVTFYTIGDDSCESEYAYQYCQKITVDHNKVEGGSHDNFPLLVNLTTDDLKWVSNGGLVENASGYDIAFKDENCNVLDYEIEAYDKDTGTVVAWVRVPSLSGSTDTEIYMYYGNSFIDCPTENPTGVWNSNYQAVYHLHDDFQDSTSNDRDGTNHGATFAAGKIGNGALFDPTDGYDYIDVGTWNVYGDDMTIQAWVYPENFGQNDPRIISKCDDDSASESNHVFMLSLTGGDNGENRMRLRIRTEYTVYPPAPDSPYQEEDTVTLFGDSPNGYLPTAQEWYFLAGGYDDDNSDEMMMYRDDGMDAGSGDHHGDLDTKSWDIWIGANPYGSDSNDYSWYGMLDEIRVLSVELSQNWLRTEYNNHNDPSSFYSLGSCTKAITPVISEWREELQ